MGRLSGFKYHQIIKRLKEFGFMFDRQAAGSHEIWYNEQKDGSWSRVIEKITSSDAGGAPMPTCWIIAGPNGAGKITFALSY